MNGDISDAETELRELRRGRGLRSDDLFDRVGPRLRLFCGIADHDSPRVVRAKLVRVLTERCAGLPGDLRLAVLAALALHGQADQKFLHDRVRWLATQLNRDPRTARRRIDEGLRLLAEPITDLAPAAADLAPATADLAPATDLAAATAAGSAGRQAASPFVSDGWYVHSMRSTLRLDVHPLTLTEERVITATADQLGEVVCALSLPRRHGTGTGTGSGTGSRSRSRTESADTRPTVTATVTRGGEIVEELRPSPGHARFVVRLPRPLAVGERHELVIAFTVASGLPPLPYYAVTPLRRYDHVRARVCFGTADRPGRVWRLNGVPPRVVEEFPPGDEPLTLDAAGAATVEFVGLRPGLSYGLAWTEARPTARSGSGASRP